MKQTAKAAIVTGFSRGIGHAVACMLSREGYHVAGIGNSPPENIKTALDAIREYGSDPVYVQGSVADRSAREKLITMTLERFGRLDVLINNAGIAPPVRLDILETTEESYDLVMDVNLKGAFFMSQACANTMLRLQKTIGDYRPVIINISSLSSYTSSVNRGEYCLSKAGMSMMTQLFAHRLAEHGISVYEILPGIIETDMTATVKEKYDRMIAEGIVPFKRWGQPEDIADAVSVLVSGKLRFVTGQAIHVDGGFHIRRL